MSYLFERISDLIDVYGKATTVEHISPNGAWIRVVYFKAFKLRCGPWPCRATIIFNGTEVGKAPRYEFNALWNRLEKREKDRLCQLAEDTLGRYECGGLKDEKCDA